MSKIFTFELIWPEDEELLKPGLILEVIEADKFNVSLKVKDE
jgi:hypothetical protein